MSAVVILLKGDRAGRQETPLVPKKVEALLAHPPRFEYSRPSSSAPTAKSDEEKKISVVLLLSPFPLPQYSKFECCC